MVRYRSILRLTLGATFLVLSAIALAGWSAEEERRIGEQVCAEIEKEYKRWDNPDVLKRVQAIVDEIVPHTDRPEVKYEVRLLDIAEKNAFSIPGGFVYVTKGLIEDVQSDDELAAVLAHEIAHNCTYDALRQAKRSSKMFLGSLAAGIVAVLLGAQSDVVSATVTAGLYARQAVLSHYSIDIEAQADANAVRYLLKTKYNPVGLLTFMERLARAERREVPPDQGIFQTHPLSRERVANLMNILTAAGVRINRRAVTQWRKPELKEVQVGEAKWPAVTWWDQTVFVVVGTDPQSASKRAQEILERLTEALAAGAMRTDFTIEGRGDHTDLVAGSRVILTVTSEDAKSQGKQDHAELAKDALSAILRALAREQLAYSF
ncbi:MAG: M48 family metalloprotease [Armatimonadetes bacterium]|nr:M48 family metalloprotease [Armatimonadota bacterium]